MKINRLFIVACSFLAASAFADECVIEVGVADNMNFVPATLEISKTSCPSVTVNLTHSGGLQKSIMGHNWVLSTTADSQAVANAGWGAGLDNQYLPPGDARVIASTDVIGGGESTSVTFDTAGLTAGGDYTFFCSFVGHYAIMKGAFVVTE